MVAVVDCLVLTEDSGKDGHAVVATLTRKLAARLDPWCQTQRLQLRQPGDELRRAAHALTWRGNDPLRRHLIRALATTLGSSTFVVVHIDGDVAWSNREAGTTRNQFERMVLSHVRGLLELSAFRGHLLLMTPHCSIEAWLYLNLPAMESEVRDPGVRAKATAQIRQWLADHATLDEILALKNECVLLNKYNGPLALTAFPMADALARSPSLAATLEQWRESGLADMLKP